MIASHGLSTTPADDRQVEQPSLRRYLDTINERLWFVILAVLVCAGASAAYVFTADKVYETHANMLVTPVPDDGTLLGLGLIRRASDPTRDVTTAALLIGNVEVAQEVVRELRSKDSPEALLARIQVEPIAQSSIVAITASGSSPREAKQLADAFGRAAVTERTRQLHRELEPAIASMRQRIEALGNPDSSESQPLYEQLAALESLRSGSDPSLRLETPAPEPGSPVRPRVKLSLAGGLLAGLLLGVTGAFALKALDTREDRDDLIRRLGLSVLTHVPDVSGSRGGKHAFEEAFRFLRATIRFASWNEPYKTIAITSVAEKEGKTTTSYQLAFAAVEAGQSVLLVEADPYRPGLHSIVDVVDDPEADTGAGLLDYLAGRATLDDIVKSTAVPNLAFIPAGSVRMESISGLLERGNSRTFVDELADLADLVILDCPPVGPRSDAVLIAAVADAVLLVVDARQSDERDLTTVVQRLRSSRSVLLGVVLNRDDSTLAEYDYREVAGNGRPSAVPGARLFRATDGPRRRSGARKG